MIALARHGFRFVPFVVGALTDEDRALIRSCRHALRAVELVVPRSRLADPLPELAVDRWIAPLGRRSTEAGYFDHFVPHGFAADEDPREIGIGVLGEGVVYRVDDDVAANIAALARSPGHAVALVMVPRDAEGRAQTDDSVVTERAVAAFDAARAHPHVTVILDTTVDHDRGYFPRHGLLDRRGNPREAFRALMRRAARP
jgi:hypothetical protein